jgi:hypothetical protein
VKFARSSKTGHMVYDDAGKYIGYVTWVADYNPADEFYMYTDRDMESEFDAGFYEGTKEVHYDE